MSKPCSKLSLTLLLGVIASSVQAAPSERLLPQTTVGMIGVRDLAQLGERWETTQLGQLVADPAMQPFVEDVQRQVRAKLMETGLRLGIRLRDIGPVCTGGTALATLQPGHEKTGHALLLMIEVTGREKDAEQLMFRTAHQLGGGQWTELGEFRAVRAKIAGAAGREGHDVYFCISHGHLMACDNVDGLKEVVATMKGQQPALADLKSFAEVMKRVGNSENDIAWYLDLFGYVTASRAAEGSEAKVANMLAEQGFDAIKSIGGQIRLATGEHELLHRTFVYTPNGTANLKKAAKLLAFVNSNETANPLTWVPSGVSNHLQIKFDFQSAFKGLGPLVNAIASEDVFDTMLENIAKEPNGPRVDIRREVLPNVGSRISLISDHTMPVSPDSERMLVAVEVKNEMVIASALKRWLRTEPRVKQHRIGGRDIWEFVPEPPQHDELLLDIDDGFGFEDAQPASAPVDNTDLLPHAAVTVANGHVLVATHMEYLTSLLNRPADKPSLANTTDFQRTSEALEKLGGGRDTVRFFTRLAAALEVTYELIRTGRMPESKSLLGIALNLLKEDSGNKTQQFDGSRMPPFREVSKYLGPHGLFVQEEELGWKMTGCLLERTQP